MSAPTILNNIILNCLLFPNYASMLSLGLSNGHKKKTKKKTISYETSVGLNTCSYCAIINLVAPISII